MESAGIYWEVPFEVLEEVGLQAVPYYAWYVRQALGRRTDRNDSIWLARVCRYEVPASSWTLETSVATGGAAL